LTTNSCDKIQEAKFPNVPVSFTIDLAVFNELIIPGKSLYFPGVGYGGIIVFCEMQDVYYAFDASCTNEISQTCRVVNDGVLGECSCCESKFIFSGGGNPAKGPAAAPLKQYNVSIVNSSTLYVVNQ